MTSNPPRAYAEWLPLLDRFTEGDDLVLDLMRRGSIEWTNVVAERWTGRVAASLTARLQEVSRRLQTGMNRSSGDPFAISRAMLDARRSLAPLYALASLPCVPQEVQSHLSHELERFVTQTQETLEESAKNIRHDHGRVLKALRDNPLTRRPAATPETADQQATQVESQPARGRRNILF